jgi:hypothetical protein
VPHAKPPDRHQIFHVQERPKLEFQSVDENHPVSLLNHSCFSNPAIARTVFLINAAVWLAC